jgi:predicted RNA polymerase sigma factor
MIKVARQAGVDPFSVTRPKQRTVRFAAIAVIAPVFANCRSRPATAGQRHRPDCTEAVIQ